MRLQQRKMNKDEGGNRKFMKGISRVNGETVEL